MIAETAKSYGFRSVDFTYNAPVIFMEYAIDVAQACHKIGIKTVAVTAGYIYSTSGPNRYNQHEVLLEF